MSTTEFFLLYNSWRTKNRVCSVGIWREKWPWVTPTVWIQTWRGGDGFIRLNLESDCLLLVKAYGVDDSWHDRIESRRKIQWWEYYGWVIICDGGIRWMIWFDVSQISEVTPLVKIWNWLCNKKWKNKVIWTECFSMSFPPKPWNAMTYSFSSFIFLIPACHSHTLIQMANQFYPFITPTQIRFPLETMSFIRISWGTNPIHRRLQIKSTSKQSHIHSNSLQKPLPRSFQSRVHSSFSIMSSLSLTPSLKVLMQGECERQVRVFGFVSPEAKRDEKVEILLADSHESWHHGQQLRKGGSEV